MKRKYFKDNDSYFKFYNKMKEKIEVIDVYITPKRIGMQYKKKAAVMV